MHCVDVSYHVTGNSVDRSSSAEPAATALASLVGKNCGNQNVKIWYHRSLQIAEADELLNQRGSQRLEELLGSPRTDAIFFVDTAHTPSHDTITTVETISGSLPCIEQTGMVIAVQEWAKLAVRLGHPALELHVVSEHIEALDNMKQILSNWSVVDYEENGVFCATGTVAGVSVVCMNLMAWAASLPQQQAVTTTASDTESALAVQVRAWYAARTAVEAANAAHNASVVPDTTADPSPRAAWTGVAELDALIQDMQLLEQSDNKGGGGGTTAAVADGEGIDVSSASVAVGRGSNPYWHSHIKRTARAKAVSTSHVTTDSGTAARGMNAVYCPHLPAALLQRLEVEKQVHRGRVTMHPRHRAEAWVPLPKGLQGSAGLQTGGNGGAERLFLLGALRQNRCLPGDEVAVCVLPRQLWQVPPSRRGLVGVERGADTDGSDDEAGLVGGLSGDAASYPCGVVVGICKRHATDFVVSMRASELGGGDALDDGWVSALVLPLDRSLPRMRLRTRQARDLVHARFVVAFTEWPNQSTQPLYPDHTVSLGQN